VIPKRGISTAYPPTSFVLLTPLALLPWRVAHTVNYVPSPVHPRNTWEAKPC
jgi:hypothetical protein